MSDGLRMDHGTALMPDPLAGLPLRFLRTPDAARFLSLSGRTLEKHRIYGTGPQYRKIGGRVVYALDDLQAWANLGAKNSTSDPGVGTVLPAKRHAVPVPYAGKERGRCSRPAKMGPRPAGGPLVPNSSISSAHSPATLPRATRRI